MKKILMLTTEFPPYRGGIGTYAWQLALAAHRLGQDVTVVAPSYGTEHGAADRVDYPFAVRRFAGGTYRSRDLVPMLWRLRRIIGSDDWDVVHAVDWPHIVGLSLINRISRVSFVATAHGTEILGVTGSRHVRLLANGRLFAAPARILTASAYTRSLLLERCPEVQAAKTTIAPSGVAERFFVRQNPAAVAAIKRKYEIPEDKQIILTVSRLDERKGHRVVLRALAALPARIKERTAYVIAGRGDDENYRAELHRLARDCGVPVVFTGEVADSDLVGLYAGADLFCMPGEPHPKKVEGFGLVYLEAAAQGVPAIASRVGAVPEVVRHNETGLLVAPRDEIQLKTALVSLLENPQRLHELGAAARDFARTFTWERCAKISYEL